MANDNDKIEMMFKLMDYDYLTDAQHDYIISFSDQFDKKGWLSIAQFETLEDIFKQASEA
jgi:hypothetical protein